MWLLDLLGGSLLTVSQQQAAQVMQQVSKEQTGRDEASCVWLPYLVTVSQLLPAELWDQPCQGLEALLGYSSEGLGCRHLSVALGFAVMSALRWSGIAQQDRREDQAVQHLLLAAKLLAQAATHQVCLRPMRDAHRASLCFASRQPQQHYGILPYNRHDIHDPALHRNHDAQVGSSSAIWQAQSCHSCVVPAEASRWAPMGHNGRDLCRPPCWVRQP